MSNIAVDASTVPGAFVFPFICYVVEGTVMLALVAIALGLTLIGCTTTTRSTSAPATADLEILSYSDNRIGNFHRIVGEVRNNGSTPAKFPKVIATFYDATGTVVDTGRGSVETAASTLGPGDKAPFTIDTPFKSQSVRYRLTAQAP